MPDGPSVNQAIPNLSGRLRAKRSIGIEGIEGIRAIGSFVISFMARCLSLDDDGSIDYWAILV